MAGTRSKLTAAPSAVLKPQVSQAVVRQQEGGEGTAGRGSSCRQGRKGGLAIRLQGVKMVVRAADIFAGCKHSFQTTPHHVELPG